MPEPATYRTGWQGIALSVTHTPEKWPGFDQIEVECEGRAALPVTPTGYKVAYLRPKDLAEYASPVSFVPAWLEFAAAAPGLDRAALAAVIKRLRTERAFNLADKQAETCPVFICPN